MGSKKKPSVLKRSLDVWSTGQRWEREAMKKGHIKPVLYCFLNVKKKKNYCKLFKVHNALSFFMLWLLESPKYKFVYLGTGTNVRGCRSLQVDCQPSDPWRASLLSAEKQGALIKTSHSPAPRSAVSTKWPGAHREILLRCLAHKRYSAYGQTSPFVLSTIYKITL